MEIDFGVDLHVHGLAVFGCGTELPSGYRFYSLLIKAHAQRPHDADVSNLTRFVHGKRQHGYARVLRSTGFLGKGRIGSGDGFGWRHALAEARRGIVVGCTVARLPGLRGLIGARHDPRSRKEVW